MTEFTIPGLSKKDGNEIADILQKAAEHVQRSAPDAQARALERRRARTSSACTR